MGSLGGGAQHHEQDVAWDDVSGELLDAHEVSKARLKELQYIREKKVYTKITRKQAQAMGVRVIGTRWIDINEGDQENKNHRSRLVAKEFKTDDNNALFAATPPLEA